MRNYSPEIMKKYETALTKRASLNGELERVKSELESLSDRIERLDSPDEEWVKATDKKRHLENKRLDIVNDVGYVEADIRMCEYQSSVCVDCD